MIMTLNLNINVFNKNWYGCCSLQTIGIVISSLIAVTGANPIILPCNVNDIPGDISEEHRTVDMLINRASAVINFANKAKYTLMSTMLSSDELSNVTFLPQERYSSTGGEYSVNTTDMALKYKYFYEEIVKLKTYLKESSKFIKTLPLEGHLNNLSLDVEKLLCDVFIEHRYLGGVSEDLNTTHVMNPSFELAVEDNHFYNQTKRVFVLLNDCINLMNAFKTMVSNNTSQ